MPRSLTNQVMLASLLVLCLTLGVATAGLRSLVAIGPTTTRFYSYTNKDIRLAADFHLHIARAVAETQSYALTGDEEQRAQAREALEVARGTLAATAELSAAEGLAPESGPESPHQMLHQSRNKLVARVEALMLQVDSGIDAQRADSLEQLEAVEQELESIDEAEQEAAAQEAVLAAEATASAIQNGLVTVGLAFGLILAAIALSIFLLRWRIVGPINHLARLSELFARGDMDQTARVTSADEIGKLQASFNQMVASIREQTRSLEREIAAADTARHEAEQARLQVVDQLGQLDAQNAVIREMSVPVLPLTGSTLVMPLIGALDSGRLSLVQDQALRAIEQSSARHFILDVTGIPVIDTQVARGLMMVIESARLLGVEVILVGIRPEVAQSIVSLGVDLGRVVTRASLQSGITYALGRAGDPGELRPAFAG